LQSSRVFGERGPSIWSWLIALAPLTAGMASHGVAFAVGVGLALGWLILMSLAAYLPRTAAIVLPAIFAAVGFFTSLFVLPFNSPAFWVASWSSLIMVIMAVPKPRPDHWVGTSDQSEGNPFSSHG
jgi:hypothetical protein